jgi:hypothetical protein
MRVVINRIGLARNKKLTQLVLVFALLIVLSCMPLSHVTPEPTSKGPDETMITATEMQTDIGRLEELVTLPQTPISAMWKIGRLGPSAGNERLPAPSNAYLVMVLRYTPDIVAEFQATFDQRVSSQYFNSDLLEPWYPEAVHNSFVYDEKTGFLGLDLPHYDVTPFAKSPWLHGFLFFPDEESVFVYLMTM